MGPIIRVRMQIFLVITTKARQNNLVSFNDVNVGPLTREPKRRGEACGTSSDDDYTCANPEFLEFIERPDKV